ncbi:ABC transporter permease [Candidatus Uhrbacteria bacterium]|nr:ABC transporter permease [Candidatus Uhrbacteria bacterium]
MTFSDLTQSAWQSLRRTRNRSLLTMLGIVIGISAVILAMSIGEAAQAFILSQLSSFGPDKLIVHPGPKSITDNPSPFVEMTLTYKDYKRLRKAGPWLPLVSADLIQTDMLMAQGTNKNVTIVGTTPDEIEIGGYGMKSGFFLSDPDIEGHSRVAVLGYTLAEEIFGQNEAVGKSIKLGTNSYRILGVMNKAGTQFFQNLDDMVYIPATTMMDLYAKEHFEYIYAKTTIPLDEAQRRIEEIMRDLHNLDNPEGDLTKDDFFIMTQADAVKTVNQITSVLQILLSSIAAISLLVGGIGIMNIMFVSVTERISEIGLRKAIGAKFSDVLRQFLAEATMLTVVGGLAGIIFGSLVAYIAIQIINHYTPGWVYIVSWRGVLLGAGVSTAIGLLFGYLPARKAAKLSPIEALRAE